MPEAARKKLHVPLPVDMHAELFEQAERLGAPATALAREAIADWLELRRREELAEEIRAYAKNVAGTNDDLDEDLEEAGQEELAEVET